MVYPDVAVLSACGKAAAVRVEGDCIDGAEVPPDCANLLHEDLSQARSTYERDLSSLTNGGSNPNEGLLQPRWMARHQDRAQHTQATALKITSA